MVDRGHETEEKSQTPRMLKTAVLLLEGRTKLKTVIASTFSCSHAYFSDMGSREIRLKLSLHLEPILTINIKRSTTHSRQPCSSTASTQEPPNKYATGLHAQLQAEPLSRRLSRRPRCCFDEGHSSAAFPVPTLKQPTLTSFKSLKEHLKEQLPSP
jgi:hypothetical protein